MERYNENELKSSYTEKIDDKIEQELLQSISDVENGRVYSSNQVKLEFEKYFGRKISD